MSTTLNRMTTRQTVWAAAGLLLFAGAAAAGGPVLCNPGLPSRWTMEIRDYVDAAGGYVTALTTVTLTHDSTGSYYAVTCREGDYYHTDIKLNHTDLTSVYETRTNLRTRALVEQYRWLGRNHVWFFSQRKPIDRQFHVPDRNIYSRYAYVISLMGFPFGETKAVSFNTFAWEYGDAITMRVHNLGACRIRVVAGEFTCYKLEISVGGWQSVFARDKFYLYVNADPPHHFVRYDEPGDNGTWHSNELIRYQVE